MSEPVSHAIATDMEGPHRQQPSLTDCSNTFPSPWGGRPVKLGKQVRNPTWSDNGWLAWVFRWPVNPWHFFFQIFHGAKCTPKTPVGPVVHMVSGCVHTPPTLPSRTRPLGVWIHASAL